MIREQVGAETLAERLRLPGRCAGPEDTMPQSCPHPLLRDVLCIAADRDASDVHLVAGHRPMIRVHGQLEPVEHDVLRSPDVQQLAATILPPAVFEQFEERKNADCSLSFEHSERRLRFRANVYLARDQWCMCLRLIPNEIPTLKWLGFSVELAERLAGYKNGLVLITGETGSGKSSSLAALVNLIRETRNAHILTIEEPIEYIHEPRESTVVTQREVGRDVDSFADGLKYGLRQDPDVILVGEIRDRETAQMAISAAETGHLILATMHTRDAKGALTRLVDLFPQDSQDDIRTQLAMSLRSVVSQKLLTPADDGQRRVLAMEVLHVTQPVQVTIRSGRFEKLDSAIQTGVRGGMLALDDDLRRLVRESRITVDTARAYAHDPANLNASGQSW
jgi:twitching motility protein PilT